MILAEIYNFGATATIMGLVVSVTANIRDNIIRSFESGIAKEEKTINDYKLYSLTYLLSAFLALLTSIITLEFQMFFDTQYVEFKTMPEFTVIVAMFAASICVAERREGGARGLWVIALVSFAVKLVMI